jgi:hypothetical protein
MKRELLAGLTIAAGANFLVSEPIEAAPTQQVHIPSLPDKLPKQVSDKEGDMAWVATTDIQTGASGGNGSAVRIGNNLYLSAGHVIDQANGQLKPLTQACGGIDLEAPTKPYTIRPLNYPAYTTSGIDLVTEKLAGSFNNNDLRVPDASLLKVNHATHELPYTPITEATPSSVRLGAELYAENYEPTANGLMRNPSEELLTPTEKAEGLKDPALIGEVVIGHYEGLIVVLDGIKGYGPSKDKFGRGGESGGAELNQKGQLVGISVRGPVDNDITVSHLEADFHINLKGIPPESIVSYALLQPITRQLINQMKRKLNDATECQGKVTTPGK